jgi:bifunctional polynucleotide phosphatase/kinase
MAWVEPTPTVRIYIPSNAISTGKVAIFDLDWTLMRPVYGNFPKFPRDAQDFELLPQRRESLQYLVDSGYSLAAMTNQHWKPEQIPVALERIQNCVTELNVPIVVFVALGKDEYRKPQPGMWPLIGQVFGEIQANHVFYVGDAAGRPGDHDDSDRLWAQHVGIPFATPEDFFPSVVPPIPTGKVVAVLMGVPASGKSTFYRTHLAPAGYIQVSQDICKTREKTLRRLGEILVTGLPVAIDNTNPAQSNRQELYDLALHHGYSVVVYYLVRNGEAMNSLRTGEPSADGSNTKKVPPVAYATYYRNLVLPTPENTPGPIYRVY